MMDNASLFYDEINSYEDIKNLIGTREDIFIDFKQTASRDGKLTDDDKANFSKAVSGFAHQQGGVLVWGISTAIDNTEVSRATELKPICRVEVFYSALYSFVRNATEPPVDGIRQKVIHENDRKESDAGFVVSLFPQSHKVHRSLSGKTRNAFYKRHGDGFHSLTTEEIKALFFRTLSPDLELIVDTKSESSSTLCLKNNGRGIAKYYAVHIGVKRGAEFVGKWFDEEGNSDYKATQVINIPGPRTGKKYIKQIRSNSTTVIHPGERLSLAVVNLEQHKGPIEIAYKLFAENMIPKESIIIVEKPEEKSEIEA